MFSCSKTTNEMNFMAQKVGKVRMATHRDMLEAGRNNVEILTCRAPEQIDLVSALNDGE